VTPSPIHAHAGCLTQRGSVRYMSLTRTLYRSILKATREYRRGQLPLTGIAGTRWAAPTADVDGYVRHLFRQPTDSEQAAQNGKKLLCILIH